ncbi:MAG: hypothetical protein PHV33_07660 [Elusimicrobiales bacterium]|nr:hypothetical protein [Elusimicrobiales bacterium]
MNKKQILIAVLAAALAQASLAGARAASFDFDGRGGAAVSLSGLAETAAEGLPEPVLERADETLRGALAAPTTSALALASFSYDESSKEFKLRFDTEHSVNYWGCRIEISVELMRDGLFDASLGVRTYEFPLNWNLGNPAITFKEADFAPAKEEGRAKTKKLYVKWGFRVVKSTFYNKDYVDMGHSASLQVPK